MMPLKIRGVDVNYYDQIPAGHVDPSHAVLFLHGWGSDFSIFRGFFDRVSYRACALDLPGFGGSSEPPRAWGMDDYADFVLAFLAELGVQSVIPVGHSFGGRIAIKFAARGNLPLRVPKMVLVDSAGIRPKKNLRQQANELLYKIVKKAVSIETVQKKFPNLLEGWRRKRGSEDYRNASPRMRECLVKVVNEDLTQYLPLITCPTLLVWGESDRATPIGDAKIMERLIPGAGLVVLKNAGHYSFLDQSYAFRKILDSFLGVNEKAEGPQ